MMRSAFWAGTAALARFFAERADVLAADFFCADFFFVRGFAIPASLRMERYESRTMMRIVALAAACGNSVALDRHPIVHCLFRAIGAIGIAPALAAAERNPKRRQERQYTLEEIAGRIRQQMKQ